MGERTAIEPSLENPDIDAIRSRIRELRDINRSSEDVPELSPLDSEQLLKDCAFQLEGKINEVLSEFSGVESLEVEDLDAYLARLKEELNSAEAENAKLSNEIEDLTRTYMEDSNRLEIELEGLNGSLDFIASQGLRNAKANGQVDCSARTDEVDYKFKMLEVSHQIENKKKILKSLQDLDCISKRFEAMDKIEDILTGIKVIEYEENSIRLLLRTYIPEGILSQHKVEDIPEPLKHELNIQVAEGQLEIKNAEISPNDIYIGEIIDAAKSYRQFSNISILESRSSLEWFVRRVKDRIILCTLRQVLVKFANKSRHFFEYLDKDEIIVAHLVGGIDACIKMSHDWPVSNHALKLISLKSSSRYSKAISLSLLCKVEVLANSLDAYTRHDISSFVDAIEGIIKQQMQLELQLDRNSKN